MPFVFLAIGVILVVAGVRGTEAQLFTLLSGDIKGFAPWFVAILAIGALGYFKAIRPITDGFMALLIVVLFLSNGGFFSKFFGASTAKSTAITNAGQLTGATLGQLVGQTLVPLAPLANENANSTFTTPLTSN